MTPVSIRTAAALLWLNGAGFGAFAIPGIVRLARHQPWWGFALPFGPVFALASTALLVLNWSHLH
jgi:hypothetical protein